MTDYKKMQHLKTGKTIALREIVTILGVFQGVDFFGH
jgi:hypothetical protein